MTVSTESNREEFACNGVTTEFEFPNYFLADEDLVVLLVTKADGTEATLELGTDYTVSGAGEAAGGTVTTTSAYASTYELVVYRDPTITQGTDLVENDPLPANELEKAYDRLTMIDQRDRELVTRSLRLPEGDTGFAAGQLLLPAKVLRANQLLGFDGDGAPVAAEVTSTVLPTTAGTYLKRNAGNTAYDAKTPGEVLNDLQAARYACRAYQSTLQSVAAATWTKVLFQTEVYDVGGGYDPSTSIYTAPADGMYLVSSAAYVSLRADGDRTALSVYVDGAEHSRIFDYSAGAAGSGNGAGSVPIKLTQGQQVAIYLYITTAKDTVARSDLTYLSIYRMG